MDELSPLFEDVEFHERFRGYDQDEVDAYIDRLANAAAVMRGRLTELQCRVEAAEARAVEGWGDGESLHETEETLTRTLVLAQRTADAAIAEAREEADRVTTEATREADATLTGARAEAQVTLRETQAEAAAILREAEEQAAVLVSEAEEQQRRLVADAEEVAAEAAVAERERLAREVAELQDYRAFLADDVEILERHLAEQRRQLAVSLSAITDLIESPEIFRTGGAPATSGVEVDPDLLAATPLEASAPIDEADEQPPPAEPQAIEEEAAAGEAIEEAAGEAVEEEPIEGVGEVPALVSQYPAPTPFDQEEDQEAEIDDEVAGDLDDRSGADELEDDREEFLKSREEFESVTEPDADLVDLTEAAQPAQTIDLEPEEPPAPEPVAGGGAGPVPGPPRLATAADFDTSGAVATAPVEDLEDGGPATEQIPLVEEASLFAAPSRADEDPFLAQLREAVAGGEAELDDEDALSAFFDQEPEDEGRSWFGRRR